MFLFKPCIFLVTAIAIATSTLYPSTSPEISLSGRYYIDHTSIKYDWPCFRISFCFINATKVIWNLKDTWNVYNIVIDENTVTKLQPNKSTKLTIFKANQPESHCIQIIKITQNHYGPLASHSDSQFNGIEIMGGSLKKFQKKYSYHFDFLGDSLTTAFGVLSGRNPICFLRMKQIQNCVDSWANKLSKKFNADSRIMAVSGKGVYQNAYGVLGPKMGNLYTRITDNSKDYSYKYQDNVIPNAIFIFLGANDYSHIVAPNSNNFLQAYTQMLMIVLRQVLIVSQKARPLIINVCDGGQSNQLCSNIKSAVREVRQSYERIYYIQIPAGALPKKNMGCIGHPNVQGQQSIASSIYPQFKKILDQAEDSQKLFNE